ncbi:MAG: polysaccharide deacetylase family protein [Planctomycetaceae bacterium]|nr:polysaccharide deacetylase family protein [Planctomycetaceae bacterium]
MLLAPLSRRDWLRSAAAGSLSVISPRLFAAPPKPSKARIAITLDLEMSAQYPKREQTEWNFEKGNLDEATKQYSVAAGKLAKELGGVIHFFCVGRVLEHPSVDWLKQIAVEGHAIGNHTYDHVNVKATKPEETQFRFQRAPWLVEGLTAREIIDRNIRVTTKSLKARAGIDANGFRTPGGFNNGLSDKPDVQQMLLDQGFSWVSSKYPSHLYGKVGEVPTPDVFESIVKAQTEAQPFVYPSGLIEVPMSPISDVGAFRSTRWSLDSYLKAIRLAVEWAIENRAVFDLLVHPSCLVVEDPEFKIIRLIADLVRAAGDRAEIVTLERIAAGEKTAGEK